ncbi:MAG: transcription antitermination factor NusB [Kiritimatiellae bacterium]|nr:transcription antitermination factor NusB [Kiritimatiellia bacterium]
MIERRIAREWAVQALCAFEFNRPGYIEPALQSFWGFLLDIERTALNEIERGVYRRKIKPTPLLTLEDEASLEKVAKMKEFAERRVKGVLGEIKQIDAALTPCLNNWSLYRLGAVERNVMRLGAWEMKHVAADAPAAVIINEAVDITKFFSTATSGRFVNAVLDHLRRNLEEEGIIIPDGK